MNSVFRINILKLASLAVVLLLIFNLFHLQVVEGHKWAQVADNNRFRHLIVTAPRGEIITADGVALASNLPGYNVALAYEPNREQRQQTIATLADLLDVSPESIADKLVYHSRQFEPVVVASNVPFETVLLLEEYRYLMPGLVIQVAPQRHYPQGTVLAHLLGRTVDYFGQEGLEGHWDRYLRGQDGFNVVQVNAAGSPIGEPVNSKPAVPGHNLHLTIDFGLQQAAEESLERVLANLREQHNLEEAWAGAVVVMDPNSGRILAMASAPSFDNNFKYSSRVDPFVLGDQLPSRVRTYVSRAVNYRRPVGSTFKMLTGLAALEHGLVAPRETIRCTGRTVVNNQPTACYAGRAHGIVDMRRALDVSCNIYFGHLGHRLGRERLYEFIARFGMAGADRDRLRIHEAALINAGFTDLSPGEQTYALDYYLEMLRTGQGYFGGHNVQAAYGQLNEFTPLQMANYVAMLANGGTHFKPYLVEQVVSASGEVVAQFGPEIISQQEFDPGNLRVIREGMVLSAAGSSFLRNLPVTVAGKTGTSEQRGWDNHAWWVGFAPYEEPELAIVVFLEHGGLGLRATEVARDIINYYFDRD